MEKKKSELQEKLESQGWELLTNTIPELDDDMDIETMDIYNIDSKPRSDEELREDYLGRGIFKEVRVDEAYDIGGNFLEGMRSIYVKRC